MKNDEYSKVKAFLSHAFVQTNVEEILSQITERKSEILDFLESPEAEPFLLARKADSDPEWVARIVDTLMTPADMPATEQAIVEALHDAAEEEEREIGRAFGTLLLLNLPIDKLMFASYFKGVPRLDADQIDYLNKKPIVQAALASEHSGEPFMASLAGNFLRALVEHGITPLTILYATKAIVSLVKAAIGHKSELKNTGISIDMSGEHISVSEPLNTNLLLQAIETRCGIGRSAASCLLTWIMDVGRSKPFLFFGLQSKKTKTGFTFTLDKDFDASNPFKRWEIGDEKPVELVYRINYLKTDDLVENASANPDLSTDDQIKITHNLGRAALSLSYADYLKHLN